MNEHHVESRDREGGTRENAILLEGDLSYFGAIWVRGWNLLPRLIKITAVGISGVELIAAYSWAVVMGNSGFISIFRKSIFFFSFVISSSSNLRRRRIDIYIVFFFCRRHSIIANQWDY